MQILYKIHNIETGIIPEYIFNKELSSLTNLNNYIDYLRTLFCKEAQERSQSSTTLSWKINYNMLWTQLFSHMGPNINKIKQRFSEILGKKGNDREIIDINFIVKYFKNYALIDEDWQPILLMGDHGWNSKKHPLEIKARLNAYLPNAMRFKEEE